MPDAARSRRHFTNRRHRLHGRVLRLHGFRSAPGPNGLTAGIAAGYHPAMLAALLSGLVLWQDPTPAPTPNPAPTPKVESPAALEAWDDRTAKAAVAGFE